MYISRSGNDAQTCDQWKPCQTIGRAVTLASRGDEIHIDGNNTDKDPYTCQSGTSQHPGIYINKSVSLIGSANPIPQIKCTETDIRINGSEIAEKMDVTFSRLLFKQSRVSIQDSSININACKFLGSKPMEILLQTRNVLSIQVIKSIFSGNSGCISVVFGKTRISSQNKQVMLNLVESSFDDNVLADLKEGFISVSGSAHNAPSLGCNITLENVTFSRNKFNSKGIVLIEMDNSNSNIFFQNVRFIDNSPSSTRKVIMDDPYSECIFRGTDLNIFINSSNFESQRARSFDLSASNITLAIYNSNFSGQRVNGNGGVVSLKGNDHYKVTDQSQSKFIDCHSDTVSFGGGGILINTTFTSPQRTSSNCILLTVLNSLFKGCKSVRS